MPCAPSATGGSLRSSTRHGWRKRPLDRSPTLLSLTQLRAAEELTRMALGLSSGLAEHRRVEATCAAGTKVLGLDPRTMASSASVRTVLRGRFGLMGWSAVVVR